MKKLPCPRIQLRWEATDQHPGYGWLCHYELVILLDEWDVRREVYKGGRQLRKKLPRELIIPMKPPSLRSGERTPCGVGDERYADTPFRDGAHAQWDGIQLGQPPIFSVAPDGKAFPVEYSEGVLATKARG